jgi:transcriptional regulator with XRE-family HTH domain
VLPTPEEGLASLGAFIRATRMARGINQARAAREAKVSRKQLQLLENGGNVSVKFLLRLARSLNLTTIPLDGRVQLVEGQSGINIFELIQSLELLTLLVDHIRDFATEAVLPASEQRKLRDTPAFKQFVASLLGEGNTGGTARLASAIVHFADDANNDAAPPQPVDAPAPAETQTRRTRRRRA